jgi:hypothetical protein
MAGTYKCGKGLPMRGDERLLKRDALVSWQNWFASSNETVAIAHWCRNVSDLIAARLTLAGSTTELIECLQKE